MSATSTSITDLKDKDKSNNPVVAFSNFMDKFKPQMALALPKHLSADRMARLAVTAFNSTPKLQMCDPKTIAGSIMTASVLGLEIGVNGQGFLVPYGQTCNFVPGWKGLVDLVNRGGRGTVFTGVIFKDQEYTFTDGAKRDLVIHNETDLDDPKDITHAYAVGWVKGASMPIIELWRVSKITKHRDKYNKQSTKHYSYRDWEMYARKIPLLQVIKYMPTSIELQNALVVNDAAERGAYATIDGDFVNVTEPTEIPQDDEPQESQTGTGGASASTAESKSEKNDGLSYAKVADSLNKATDLEVLDVAADLINEVADEKQRDELRVIYLTRKEALDNPPEETKKRTPRNVGNVE